MTGRTWAAALPDVRLALVRSAAADYERAKVRLQEAYRPRKRCASTRTSAK